MSELTTQTGLKIATFNVCGYNRDKSPMNDLSRTVHVLGISETWLRLQSSPPFGNRLCSCP